MRLRLVKDLTAVLLELPISVVEGANLASLQPSGDTMEMEGVLATHSQSLLMEAWKSLLRCKFPMQQCTPRWWLKLDLLDIRCLPLVSGSSSRVGVGDELHRSIMWFLQMAQLSTTMSQAHRATAFHYRAVSISAAPWRRAALTFFTSKRFLPSAALSEPPALALPTAFFAGAGISVITTSAMFRSQTEAEKGEEVIDGGVVERLQLRLCSLLLRI